MTRYRLQAAACLFTLLWLAGSQPANAQGPPRQPQLGGDFRGDGGRDPRFDGRDGKGNQFDRRWSPQRPFYGYHNPQFSQSYGYGWLQRPYPYHLDYYKMKYGGSYEPYFGNLYGPPVFNQFFAPGWPIYNGTSFW